MPSRFESGRRISPVLNDDNGEQITAAIAIVLLVLLGGLIIYASHDPVRTADMAMRSTTLEGPPGKVLP
jgi:hypothetical protein